MSRNVRATDWAPHLRGVDVVINAVGILRESATQLFSTLHVAGPCALFEACVEAGVQRVINISALGADDGAVSAYHRSKKEADDFLLRLPLRAIVVQPSLVYGAGGASACLFAKLATMPLIPLPGQGEQLVQPIHVDDAVQAIVALVHGEQYVGERVALVGARPINLRDFLVELRQAMRLEPPWFLPLPMPLVKFAATVGGRVPASLLDRETLGMLERGNTGPPEATRALLGRSPREPSAFISPPESEGTRALALVSWLLPLLRFSIAIVWFVSGVVSFGVFPRDESYALLARADIETLWAPSMLFGAAALDLAFGFGTLLLRNRYWLWLAQLALIIVYTLIITVYLPEFWAHPFGPILKNIPMVAVLVLLIAFEQPREKR